MSGSGSTSATGGYIEAIGAEPSYDDAFDRLITALVVGIVGISESLVRPRWQEEVPKQPEPNVDWCAIGVMSATPDSSRGITVHNPNGVINQVGDGNDDHADYERVEIMASFYGPNAWANAGFLDSGMRIPQNNEALRNAGIGFVNTGTRRQMSELYGQKVFVRRVDIMLKLNRVIGRVYPIYNLLRASGVVYASNETQKTIDTPFNADENTITDR